MRLPVKNDSGKLKEAAKALGEKGGAARAKALAPPERSKIAAEGGKAKAQKHPG